MTKESSDNNKKPGWKEIQLKNEESRPSYTGECNNKSSKDSCTDSEKIMFDYATIDDDSKDEKHQTDDKNNVSDFEAQVEELEISSKKSTEIMVCDDQFKNKSEEYDELYSLSNNTHQQKTSRSSISEVTTLVQEDDNGDEEEKEEYDDDDEITEDKKTDLASSVLTATVDEEDDDTYNICSITKQKKKKVANIVKEEDDEYDDIPPEELERATRSREFEHSIEDPIDLDMFRDNVITIQLVDIKDIPENKLSPREQEEADEPVREGMKYLFDNKFMKAKNIFQSNASYDPLYALGLGAMAFIKAIMTYHDSDIEVAMHTLESAYTVAKTQAENSAEPRKLFSQHLLSLLLPTSTSRSNSNSTGSSSQLPNNLNGTSTRESGFIHNGVLRAHVIKAECCLLSSILQMTQESMIGYLKCGLNLRRAYNSYNVVWQEYKKMGQEYSKYMDRDTVSAIQFGIGAVHLILSSLPTKVLNLFSVLGWKSDKQLGFDLLKLCLEGRGIRSPLASLTLLSYYSILTSFAPQLYSKEMMSPALECLLDAQKNHPNSCFFLFFAARIARVARNIPLSIQSFTFSVESSRGEWAEVAMKQMSDYEIGFNLALQLDWEGAANYFEQLCRECYWSVAFSKYFVGCCRDMMGQRTEAILAFAQVPKLAGQSKGGGGATYIDVFVKKKVEFFQSKGYQDMDYSLPILEILLVLNAFEYMEKDCLEKCLEMVQNTLEIIYEREKIEYNIRLRELVPTSKPPDYYDQRAVLLLIKSSILNSLDCHGETIAHLNWIMDHKNDIKTETWVIPFAYWESGVTSWGLGNYKKSRMLWQLAMGCTKYDFEHRMVVRLSLALSLCDEAGVTHIENKELKGPTTNGRKRMPIMATFS